MADENCVMTVAQGQRSDQSVSLTNGTMHARAVAVTVASVADAARFPALSAAAAQHAEVV